MPAFVTVILWVVAPLLHKLPVSLEEVSTVDPPAQNELSPEMVGVVGKGVILTATELEASEVQPEAIVCTE